MAKTLPTTFPALDLDRLNVGEPIRSSDYTTMVERMHHLWACHRGRCTGWEWDYRAMSSGDLTNSIAGEPDLQHYQPVLLASRPLSGSVVRVGFRVFCRLSVVNANIYSLTPGAGAPTLIETATAENIGTAWAWAETTVDLDLADVTVSGEIVPILFRFTPAAPAPLARPAIKRIQPFEAGIFDLSASDIP